MLCGVWYPQNFSENWNNLQFLWPCQKVAQGLRKALRNPCATLVHPLRTLVHQILPFLAVFCPVNPGRAFPNPKRGLSRCIIMRQTQKHAHGTPTPSGSHTACCTRCVKGTFHIFSQPNFWYPGKISSKCAKEATVSLLCAKNVPKVVWAIFIHYLMMSNCHQVQMARCPKVISAWKGCERFWLP